MRHESNGTASQERSRPNLIWIFGDQHRAQAVGYAGDPNCHTPNLDRLAGEGLEVTGAVAGSPLCSPFRGSLLCSRYPHECVPGHESPLPTGQRTIAHAFDDAGYHTAYFGKWHVDGHREADLRSAMHIVPPNRRGGFRHWTGYQSNPCQWDSWVHGGEGEDAFHDRLDGFEADALTNLFIQHVENLAGRQQNGQNGEPFFAVLSLESPHPPYHAPAQWMGRHTPGKIQLRPNVPNVPRIVEQVRRDLAGYYAMIENLDWNVGRIRDALTAAGIAENTHIVFFSDHGDMHGSHGQEVRKTSPHEESIRIPFIIGGMHPYYFGKRGRVDLPINHVDIAPTSLGLCGISPPDWMVGTDYSAYRLGGPPPADEPDEAYLQLVAPRGNGKTVDRPWRGIVTRDGWKYVSLEGQPWMMFNLREDPYEQANLAFNSLYRAERQRLQARLAAWIDKTGDHFVLDVSSCQSNKEASQQRECLQSSR